jgi:hypothetical protein
MPVNVPHGGGGSGDVVRGGSVFLPASAPHWAHESRPS